MGDNRNHSADSRAHMDSQRRLHRPRRHRGQGSRHRLAAEPDHRPRQLPGRLQERARRRLTMSAACPSLQPRLPRGPPRTPFQSPHPAPRADLQGARCPVPCRRRRGGARRPGRPGQRGNRRRGPADAKSRSPACGTASCSSPAERERLEPLVRSWSVASAVGHASAAEIDALGIIAALRLAGTRAWLEVLAAGITPDVGAARRQPQLALAGGAAVPVRRAGPASPAATRPSTPGSRRTCSA